MKRMVISSLIILALVTIPLSGCKGISPQASRALQLEEHQLNGAPDLVPLGFQPFQGTQEEVLAEHADKRALVVSNEVNSIEGNPTMSSLGESGDLTAVLLTAAEGQPEQTVQVSRGVEIIFEAPAGLPSPTLPLQALWTYDGHWAIEILFADLDTWAGQVFIDGELVNGKKGYDEAFGFQLLADKPFFFFMRDGHAGYSYDGHETNLDYEEIPHYRCCAETEMNPLQAQNMVAFFAMREQTWFYVELGELD